MIDNSIDSFDTNNDTEGLDDSLDDIKYLDENTIDEYFLPRVKDGEGNAISVKQASYDSPFENQENPPTKEDGVSLFRPDAWGETELIKGVDLYQICSQDGTNSCYFTDQDTINACVDFDTGELDIERLKSMLQIYDIDDKKVNVSKYTVEDDGIRAAIGVSSENPEYGIGGGTQYFIPNANEYKSLGLLLLDESFEQEKHTNEV